MSTRTLALAALTALSFASLFPTAAALAQSPPGISLERARSIALHEVPGTILEEDLEHEDGVLVYEFEILRTAEPRVEVEVSIDASTGRVVEIEHDDDDDSDDDQDDDDDDEDDD